MPKIRIHELAKEINKTNKEVIEFLKEKQVDIKSHMSTLEEKEAKLVRQAFGDKESKAEVTAMEKEKPKKKSNIVQVFRPQNASTPEGKNLGKNNRPGQGNQPRPQGQAGAGQPRPQGQAGAGQPRPQGQAGAGQPRPQGQPTTGQPRTQTQPATDHARSQAQPGADQERPQGQTGTGQPRPQGQAGAGQPRPQGQARPQGQSGNHQDRNQSQGGQQRYQGQNGQPRQQRPYGQGQGGQQRSYGQGQGGQQRSYGQGQGGQQRSYGQGQGGQQRSYGQGQGGQQRSYGQGQGGQQRSYGQGQGGQQRSYGQGQGGQQRSYGQGQGGQQRSYGQGQGGQQRPYGQGQGGQQRNQGFRDGQRPQGDRDHRDFRRGPVDNRRNDGHKPTETSDAALVRKPTRDTTRKEKDKVKETQRAEKLTNDRRNAPVSKRPNQGFRQHSRLPKALQKQVRPQPKEEKKEEIKEITLPEKMTIRELADKMKMQPSVIVKKLFMEGIMVTVNHEIDFEKAQEIALGYDIIAEPEVKIDVIEELLKEEDEDESTLVARPPVVCVMGHVDHGKTSLLDCIRKTKVIDREAGGITQHIGAYTVTVNGQKIAFLDTPGHEAFTAMRMRGANSTDIAILVVAADDGVMPQTVEAINHAKAAGVEIIVAINKIDKPSANIERVKQELSEYELIPEDWGGSTIFVPVSAHTREGIDELLDMILLTAEVCELKANPKRKARGLVIEAKLDKGKGSVATILVQKGTLHIGDFIAAGACSGKVRAMMDDKGRRVKEAGPSTPVEILGLNDVPNAGEVLVVTDNDKEAKNFAATFVSENKNKLLDDTKAKMSLDDLFTHIKEGNLKELGIVVKADVQGSVEAVKQSLVKLSNEEVVVKVVHGGVGAINESDVTLASASNAIIIGFNVRPDVTAKAIAEQEGVEINLYRVIYQAIEDVESAMKGLLDPIFEEKVIGHAEVRQVFKASGIGNIAGSYVLDGIFERGSSVRITREGTQIFEGTLASLKRFKDDVKEVRTGYECGLVFEGFNDIQELDQVEAYKMVEVPR